MQAFTDYLMEHELTIFLVLFDGKAFGLAASLFDDLKSYVDDHYVDAQHRREHPFLAGRRRAEPRPRPDRPAQDLAREDAASGALGANEAADLSCGAALAAPKMAQPSASSSLSDYLSQSETTFSEYLRDLLIERGGKDSEVYKRAEVSKQLFSKILCNRDYQPTKSTAIQLAIGLQLDLVGTQKLLEKAGYSLTRSSKADLVVQYCIERRIYSVTFINEALYDCALPLLKTGLKS